MSAWISRSSSTWAIFSCSRSSISRLYSAISRPSLSVLSNSARNLVLIRSRLIVLLLERRQFDDNLKHWNKLVFELVECSHFSVTLNLMCWDINYWFVMATHVFIKHAKQEYKCEINVRYCIYTVFLLSSPVCGVTRFLFRLPLFTF